MPATAPPKTFVCALCSVALRTRREFDTHMCLAHDDCGEARLGTPITFRCATCGEAFPRRGDLFAHMKRCDHGHPEEWDKARPPGTQRPRRRARSRGG